MKKKYMNDYLCINEKLLEGYVVSNVTSGFSTNEKGLIIELERQIDNVTIGIDIVYNPDHVEDDTELMISNEFVKKISTV